nr:hypothetical protein [Otarine picobirnavirus]AMP18962.1 hypothetical protein [Otarine picobirnavirus]AMP18964.1 hypothetical protein [Otarine picobirnavirus]
MVTRILKSLCSFFEALLLDDRPNTHDYVNYPRNPACPFQQVPLYYAKEQKSDSE